MSHRLLARILLSLPLLVAPLFAAAQTMTHYSFSTAQFCTLDDLGQVDCVVTPGYERLTPPSSLPALTAIAAGETHACGITIDGQAVCWGDNYYGQQNVPSISGFLVQIDAGANQTCALDTNGAATCWGLNSNGQLEPPEDASFLQVDTAGVMSCGLLTNREVVCWTDDDRRFPQKLVGPFTKIDLRSGGVCGLTENGNIRCSDNSDVSPPIFPMAEYIAPPNNGPYSDMAVTRNAVCGLTNDGALDCTFLNSEDASVYPLGDNFSRIQSNETDILSSTGQYVNGQYAQVVSGNEMCGEKTDGSIQCWDTNEIFASPGAARNSNEEFVANFELVLDARVYGANATEIFWTPLPYSANGADNIAQPTVEIFRNGELIDTLTARFSYFDATAEDNSEYQIRLVDEAGNTGPLSGVLSVNAIEGTVLFNGEPTLTRSPLEALPDVFTNIHAVGLFVGIVIGWEVNSDVESLIDGYEIRVNGSPVGFTRSRLFVDTSVPQSGRCVEIIAVGFDQTRLGARAYGRGCN